MRANQRPHKHKWHDTGKVMYSCPLQYEQKCKCGRKRNREGADIEHVKMTEAHMRRFYDQYFSTSFTWEEFKLRYDSGSKQ